MTVEVTRPGISLPEHKMPDSEDSRTDHERTQTGEADVGDQKSAVSGDMNEAGDAGSEKSGAKQETGNPENENQRGWLADLIVSAHFAADERAEPQGSADRDRSKNEEQSEILGHEEEPVRYPHAVGVKNIGACSAGGCTCDDDGDNARSDEAENHGNCRQEMQIPPKGNGAEDQAQKQQQQICDHEDHPP